MLAVTVTALLLSAFVVLYQGPQSFFLLAILIPFFVGAYWAYVIRRRLAIRVYRNQALGIGVLGVLTGIGFLVDFIIRGTDSTSIFLIYVLTVPAYGFTFYWVDASMLAVRLADPLLRDPLRWTRTRFILWPLIMIGLFFLLLAPLVPTNLLNVLEIDIATVLINFSTVAPYALGAVLLPLLARRARDVLLPGHLNWFALFALMLVLLRVGIFVNSLVPAIYTSLYLVLANILLVASAAFCLYRSARALAPLNRVSALD